MEVLSSRILIRPSNPERSRAFYRDTLGLAVYREFGPTDNPGVVFFAGHGFIEVSGQSRTPQEQEMLAIWLQVRDIQAERERLAALGAPITRPPKREPWGLVEMWLEDPDGVRVVLVEIPSDHPLRRDQR